MMWEYRQDLLPDAPQVDAYLNEMGRAGWELVSVVVTRGNTKIAYWKRDLS